MGPGYSIERRQQEAKEPAMPRKAAKAAKAPNAAQEKLLRVRITLEYTDIWREVAAPPDITLGQLHDVIQIVMGWDDDHLHHFFQKLKRNTRPSPEEHIRYFESRKWDPEFEARMCGRRFFVPRMAPDGMTPLDMEGIDEQTVLLAEVCPDAASKLTYEYDFGDSWKHEIKVKRNLAAEPGAEYPICLGGEKACPREDSGGIYGYYTFLEALSDPEHERHEDAVDWLGPKFDPDAFDLKKVNQELARWRKRR
jgi:hypothetical protein